MFFFFFYAALAGCKRRRVAVEFGSGVPALTGGESVGMPYACVVFALCGRQEFPTLLSRFLFYLDLQGE